MALSGSEIRNKFISYFRDRRGHLHLPSSSLIPDNPTLLLTSAGMVQFVPIFLGQAPATNPPRATTVQKCARAGGKDSDIENIGRTARHHSFFEMLGNFSFGDYFKKEVIPWAWEFVTEELGLPKDKLSVTVFAGDELNPFDDEAFDIWNKVVGLPKERIFRMSRKDNFWGPPGPTGPCGPCSEIYFDRGPDFGCSTDPEVCGIGKCECDRYLEFWNLVFMELYKDENGAFSPLARKNVDTGAGFERIATILQDRNSSFDTDLFQPIVQAVSKLAGVEYHGAIPRYYEADGSVGIGNGTKIETVEEKNDRFLKVISDHARCVTFLVADGVRPSNIGRGYVLRFIIRRACRFARLLGIKDPFLFKLVQEVESLYGQAYPEITASKSLIEQVLKREEEQFAKTIERGNSILEEILAASGSQISGADAFNLHATYGFPFELTKEIALEKGKTIDTEGFESAKKEHEAVSSVNKFNVIIAGDESLGKILKEHGQTKFLGYNNNLKSQSEVVAVVRGGKVVAALEEGDEADVVLNVSPFYAESGGQVGDAGTLEGTDGKLTVLDTKKHEGLHLHRVRAVSGVIEPGAEVTALVDSERRNQTMLHHSTAHLFHAALHQIFGEHVVQAGSQVGPSAMRFDFTLERQPTQQELMKVESLMNEWTRANYPVTTVEMPLDEAKKTGAVAMFGEKYGDLVRVVKMGDFSLEFCGGTHVFSTGEIGSVKIISEGSVASGVRRVEALSGPKAWNYITESMSLLSDAAGRLKVKPQELISQMEALQDQVKQKEKQAQLLQEKLALASAPALLAGAETIGGIKLIAAQLQDISPDGLKSLAESLRSKEDNIVVALAVKQDEDKVTLVAAVSDLLTKKGINAGALAKEMATICGGGGGGRPQIAQAGGKDVTKIGDALKK